MMSTGSAPGMSHAVRVLTSSQTGASGRCPECIRAAGRGGMGGDVGSAGVGPCGRSRGLGCHLVIVCAGAFSALFQGNARWCSTGPGRGGRGIGDGNLTFENLDAKGIDPVGHAGVRRLSVCVRDGSRRAEHGTGTMSATSVCPRCVTKKRAMQCVPGMRRAGAGDSGKCRARHALAVDDPVHPSLERELDASDAGE